VIEGTLAARSSPRRRSTEIASASREPLPEELVAAQELEAAFGTPRRRERFGKPGEPIRLALPHVFAKAAIEAQPLAEAHRDRDRRVGGEDDEEEFGGDAEFHMKENLSPRRTRSTRRKAHRQARLMSIFSVLSVLSVVQELDFV
jgi:hypothetical protein